MYLSSTTTITCPYCDNSWDEHCAHTNGIIVVYQDHSPLDRLTDLIKEFKEVSDRNPKVRIWHQPAPVARVFRERTWQPPCFARTALQISGAQSAVQRRQNKRKQWQRQMRRERGL